MPADGHIVFRRYLDADQTKGAVYVMNADGTGVHRVTRAPAGWKDNVPAWSSDGRRITFERFKSDESTSRILVVDPATGTTSTVVPCAPRRCAYAIDPSFTPDGRSIAYARTVVPAGTKPPPLWRLYTAIFVVGLDGKGARQVTSTPARHPGRPSAFEATDPTFSPDGRLLLVRCTPRGEDGPSSLFLLHPDGTGLRQLAFGPSSKQYLGSGFSPGFQDGHGWIVAGRTGGVGADGNADVFRLLVRHGEVVRKVNLTRSEKWDSSPGWGP